MGDGERHQRLRTDQARTRLARAAVTRAAGELFVERGFGATTIEAVSAAAQVPAPTVYRLFGSKVGILRAVLDVAIGGDDEDVRVGDRAGVQSALAEKDPAALLAGFVRVVIDINRRTAALYQVLEAAAAADREVRPLLDDLTRQRSRGQRMIARTLAERGDLRRDLKESDAADLVHALLSPELYRLLVLGRRWSIERYESWLSGLLTAQLLPRLDR